MPQDVKDVSEALERLEVQWAPLWGIISFPPRACWGDRAQVPRAGGTLCVDLEDSFPVGDSLAAGSHVAVL